MESARRQAIEDEQKAREHAEDREEKRLQREEAKLTRAEAQRRRDEAQRDRDEKELGRGAAARARDKKIDDDTKAALAGSMEQEAAEAGIEDMTGFSVDEAVEALREFLPQLPGGGAALDAMGGVDKSLMGPAIVGAEESIRGAGETERQRLVHELSREKSELETQSKYEKLVEDYMKQNFGVMEKYDELIDYPVGPDGETEDEKQERLLYEQQNPRSSGTRFRPHDGSRYQTYEEARAAAEEAVGKFYQATMQQEPRMSVRARVQGALAESAAADQEAWENQRSGGGEAAEESEPAIDQAKLEKIEALLRSPGVAPNVKEQLMAERDRILGAAK
jgi:hypothetical protein